MRTQRRKLKEIRLCQSFLVLLMFGTLRGAGLMGCRQRLIRVDPAEFFKCVSVARSRSLGPGRVLS